MRHTIFPSVAPLKRMLDLNTLLLLEALGGVTEQQARLRPNETTNHLAFLACHLVDARYFLAKQRGSK